MHARIIRDAIVLSAARKGCGTGSITEAIDGAFRFPKLKALSLSFFREVLCDYFFYLFRIVPELFDKKVQHFLNNLNRTGRVIKPVKISPWRD